jgi:hypothetical protein
MTMKTAEKEQVVSVFYEVALFVDVESRRFGSGK